MTHLSSYTKNKTLGIPGTPRDQLKAIFEKWADTLAEAEECLENKRYHLLSELVCKVIEGMTALSLIVSELNSQEWDTYIHDILLGLTRFSATMDIKILKTLKTSFIEISKM